MTQRKRVVAWVLALAVLAGLGGCAKPAEKEDGNWFEDSVIVNTALTRKALSENPVVSTDEYYSTILDWVDLYIRGNYNASTWGTTFSEKHYTLKMVSGEKSFFTIIFCETNFQSDVTPEGFESANGSYQLRIQMVIKTGKNYYEGPFTLIGFVTNQERQIIEPRELYDFIKGVPDYKDTDFIVPEPMKLIQLAALGYDFTDTKMDDESGLSVVNLRSLTGGLEVDDFTFLPGDLLAILTVNPEVQNEKVLMVFKAEELRLLYQKTFSYPAGDYPAGGHVEFYNINGTLVLEQKLGDEIYKYFIPTMSGVLETPEPKRTYRLSDTAFIVDEKNCLYLEQNGVRKLLLEGIYEEDSTDWENYNFFCRINDTRFIYEVYGYEWYVECGIFDVKNQDIGK